MPPLAIPLRLRDLWTPAEIKELSKPKAPPQKEKKKKYDWQLRPKPKFGQSTDNEKGAPGLFDDIGEIGDGNDENEPPGKGPSAKKTPNKKGKRPQ